MQPRILLVDNDTSILFALREYFTTYGYQVDCAQELVEAQALLAKGCCSVVITDLCLTGTHSTEGLEMVRYVREHYPSIRTVVLTGYGSPEIETEARRRGADAFLHKSRSLPEVAQIISELLGREP